MASDVYTESVNGCDVVGRAIAGGGMTKCLKISSVLVCPALIELNSGLLMYYPHLLILLLNLSSTSWER